MLPLFQGDKDGICSELEFKCGMLISDLHFDGRLWSYIWFQFYIALVRLIEDLIKYGMVQEPKHVQL